MFQQNIDTKLQKRVQSKEFEESVDQAVRSFMYDLDATGRTTCFFQPQLFLHSIKRSNQVGESRLSKRRDNFPDNASIISGFR